MLKITISKVDRNLILQHIKGLFFEDMLEVLRNAKTDNVHDDDFVCFELSSVDAHELVIGLELKADQCRDRYMANFLRNAAESIESYQD